MAHPKSKPAMFVPTRNVRRCFFNKAHTIWPTKLNSCSISSGV